MNTYDELYQARDNVSHFDLNHCPEVAWSVMMKLHNSIGLALVHYNYAFADLVCLHSFLSFTNSPCRFALPGLPSSAGSRLKKSK